MTSYRRQRKRRFNIKRFFLNLVFMTVLASVVFVSGRLVIKTAYAVLTSMESGNGTETQDTVADFFILVNKEHKVSQDYVPKNLVEVDIRFSPGTASQQRMMQETAAGALATLFTEAEDDGIILYGVSGYRSYDYQRKIYDRKVNAVGRKQADKYVAYPGQSEHHTGLAMDVINEEGVSKLLTASFGKTKEGQWLNDNAHEFGFIIRYPEGKEDVTGYNYEPWHLRYVGKESGEITTKIGIYMAELFPGLEAMP
jgi:D-alanyl-D-alanine carboxypeptidase